MMKLTGMLGAILLFCSMAGERCLIAGPPQRDSKAGEDGLFYISSYSRRDYAASSQNWGAVQDHRGIMYFANTTGILEYDGNSWRTINVSNVSAARCLAIDSSGRVYVGAQNEFGYLEPDSTGLMQYRSLIDLLDAADRNFSDIRQVFVEGERVYFRSQNYLFCLENRTLRKRFSKEGYHRAHVLDDGFYIQKTESGLFRMEKDTLIPLTGTAAIGNEIIYSMAKDEAGRLILFTRKGSFKYDGIRLEASSFPVDDYLSSNQVYSSAITPEGHIAFATTRGGIVIANRHGQILNMISQQTGLNDDNVRFLYFDREQNLWVCLNNGISKIAYTLPVTYYNETFGLKGSVQAVTRHKGTLYAATSSGVFLMTPKDYSSSRNLIRFTQIPGLETQCWSFLSLGDYLLAGTNNGLFRIDGPKPELLAKGIPYFIYYSRTMRCVFVGFQNGLGVMEFNGRLGVFRKIEGIREEIRSVTEDNSGSLWLGTRLKYTLRVDFRNDFRNVPEIQRFDEKHGLPSSRIFTFNIGGKILFTTSKGTFRYQEQGKIFIPDSTYTYRSDSTFQAAVSISRNDRGEVWLVTHENKNISGIGFFRQQPAGKSTWHYQPFLRMPPDPYYCLYFDDGGIVWAGGPAGLIRYNEQVEKNYRSPFSAYIREVCLLPDSVLFYGTFPSEGVKKPVLPYAKNSIRFQYAAASFDDEPNMEYQFSLEGYEEGWSEWNKDSKKEYTNLPEGDYRFHVRARNSYACVSGTATYEFRVLPPWQRTWWAYMMYGGMLLSAIWVFVQWRLKRLRREKVALESIVAQRTAELKDKKEQLEKIDLIVRSINTKFRLGEFLNSLIHEIGFIEKVQRVAMLVHDPQDGSFHFRACRGWSMDHFGRHSLSPSLTMDLFAKTEDLAGEDVFLIQEAENRFKELMPEFVIAQSLLVLRIQDEERISGYLIFGRQFGEEKFSASDVALLSNLRKHILSGFMKSQLLTSLEEANAELKKLNDQKNEFLGIAAHDLRNPLGAIIGYLDLIQTDMRSGTINIPDTVADIDMVLNSARQMVSLITELLDISAIESGKVNLEIQRHNLNQVFEECERIHKKAATQKRIRLIIDKNDQLPEVMIDKSRIAEVVDNLLSNAIKYTFPDGQVRLYTELRHEEICVHVQDSGQGLNDHDLQEVFRSFKKLSARPTGGESSTGFGLAIVKKIVDLHNGRVWVESRKGSGSIFSFSLPLDSPCRT